VKKKKINKKNKGVEITKQIFFFLFFGSFSVPLAVPLKIFQRGWAGWQRREKEPFFKIFQAILLLEIFSRKNG